MGSVAIMLAISFMIGTDKFFKAMCSRVHLPYFLAYTISLGFSIYFSCISKNYFGVIIFSGLQFMSLTYLLLANIPYGRQTLNFLYKTLLRGISIICKVVCKKTINVGASNLSNGGILPF